MFQESIEEADGLHMAASVCAAEVFDDRVEEVGDLRVATVDGASVDEVFHERVAAVAGVRVEEVFEETVAAVGGLSVAPMNGVSVE